MHDWHAPVSLTDKSLAYQSIIPQLSALVQGENNLYANLANVAAGLKETFNWWWVGFYLVQQDELVLGPFQGPVACTRIAKGKGVCGAAWEKSQTIVVSDVHQFPGHIACSSQSKSEIVVPIIKDNRVVAVLDADSEFLQHFDETDALYLQKVADLLASLF
jgi:L-methionine (R)-S-oxide reductase